MVTIGLNARMVDLIMGCGTSVSFSSLINGTPKGHIVPSKGLRQGDCLSLYLLLLCIEGLISLLSNPTNEFILPKIEVYRGASSINHLLFVDNSVIFCKVDTDTTKKEQILLNVYKKSFEQLINLDKIAMVFSKSTPLYTRQELVAM